MASSIPWQGDVWCRNTLERVIMTGQKTYTRTLSRNVEWPKPKKQQRPAHEDPIAYTTFDEAFSAMMIGLSQATKQCKRHHRSQPPSQDQPEACYHGERFHSDYYTTIHRSNKKEGKVHVIVPAGGYSISAGRWGSDQQQTYQVDVRKGEAVELDFVV